MFQILNCIYIIYIYDFGSTIYTNILYTNLFIYFASISSLFYFICEYLHIMSVFVYLMWILQLPIDSRLYFIFSLVQLDYIDGCCIERSYLTYYFKFVRRSVRTITDPRPVQIFGYLALFNARKSIINSLWMDFP